MDINYIIDKVNNRTPKPMDVKYKYSVLIPMIKLGQNWELIYELRAKTLKRQPGEISFPGGGVEKGETFRQAAIRETMEELNIGRNNINLIGELDYFVSYYNSTIHSFLGIIEGIDKNKIKVNRGEVECIFTVPLDFFLKKEPDVYYIDLCVSIGNDFPFNLIPDGKGYGWQRGKYPVYFYEYEDYIIWGYTAKITKYFIDIIRPSKL